MSGIRPEDSAKNHIQPLAFFILVVLSVVFWWQPLVADFHVALESDANNYILLVLPLSIGLIRLKARNLHPVSKTSLALSTILIGLSVVVRLVFATNTWQMSFRDSLSLNMAALVVFWVGSAILGFGLETFSNNLFPLCFLFLIVPLPDPALGWITAFLQRQSAWAATILFHAAGVPVTRDGIMLSIPGLDIEVARECSSIRSSTLLMVVTLILAHLFLRTWSRKFLLILAAIPLAFLKNAVRIFTIAELGTRVDQGFLDGRLHHEGGFIFLSLAIIADVLLLVILRKTEKRARKIRPQHPLVVAL